MKPMVKFSPHTKIIISQNWSKKKLFYYSSFRKLLLRSFGIGVKKIIFSGIFTLGILFFPGAVLAATDISVAFPNSPGPMITETNILPGDVFTRTVTITKINNDDKALMLRLDRMNPIGTYNLESKILVKIQRLPGGPFLPLPGGGTEKNLESLYNYLDSSNSDAFQFDSISGLTGSTFQYKMWFTFDPMTDNYYQGKSTTFDILMGIYTAETTDTTDNGGHHHNNGGGPPGGPGLLLFTGGRTTQGQTQGTETTEEEKQGVTREGQNPEVAGEITTCKSWPLWVWILAIVIFALNFWRNARKNYKNEKYKWIHPLVWTIIAVIFWYYFDKCREYRWFLYDSIIIAIASHFIYLYYLRKKVKQGMPVEKEETTKTNETGETGENQ
jgi:hypothetical protein